MTKRYRSPNPLFSAVGLYQRDDRVTLCTVSMSNISCGGNPSPSIPLPCGDLYFPALSDNSDERHKSFVRSWNETLCDDGVSFATEILWKAIQQLSKCDSLLPTGDVLFTEILPCLASGICLIPSCIPTLSIKYAMELLPFVTKCAKSIDKFVQSKETSFVIDMKGGEWKICTSPTVEGTPSSLSGNAKGSSNSFEAYIVPIERDTTQNTATGCTLYEGKSLNNDFSIIGTSCGTHVYLVENTCIAGTKSSSEEIAHISAKSHVIEARLSLDGASFEGVRYHVGNGSSERVTGFLQHPSSIEAPSPSDFMKRMIHAECLLSLGVGHLSLILCSQTSMSDVDNDVRNKMGKKSLDSLLSTSVILSMGVLDHDGSFVRRAVDSLWDRCKSEDMLYTEIRDQWKNAITKDLLHTTDKSMSNAMKMEDVMSIIEQQGTTFGAERMGSFSRLCPDKYATAQKSIAGAIFYHTYRSLNETMLEVVSQAIQYSLQILENGVREALIRKGKGIRLKSICENHCSLVVLATEFLFEFSCMADIKQSMPCIFDDIALIYKSIHSEEDLDYIKLKLRVRTDQCTIQCVGLRSLHFLLQPENELQGIKVHAAVETALTSLPRLLYPSAVKVSSDMKNSPGSSNYCTSRLAGCTSIQSCIRLSVRNIYAHIGSILDASVHQVTKSPTLGLLACYFTDVHPNEHQELILNVLPSLRILMDRCREQLRSPNTKLLDFIYKQRNIRLLETSATILLVSCGQLSHCSSNSSLADALTEKLFHEISETLVLAAEDARIISDLEEKESLGSDWITCRTFIGAKPTTSQAANANIQSSKIPEFRLERLIAPMNQPVQSEVQSYVYLNHLLDVLYVVIHAQSFNDCINTRSGALLSSIGFIFTVGDEGSDNCPTMYRLPLRIKRRLLRLLRPILLATNADSSVIRQLFILAGTYVSVARGGVANYSKDGLLMARSSISLLRHLYMFSSSWRYLIHQQVTTRESDELSTLHGVLAFFGGVPGSLSPGEFVIIDPEAASSSPSTIGSSKYRYFNALGSGAEEIAVGLCRYNSLSGIISSVDSHHGTCEVVLLDARTDSDCTIGGTSITTRAVHVSAANISAADELPLCLDVTNLPAMDVFTQLSGTFKNISTAISSNKHVPGSALKLDIDAHVLMECSLGLRSMTVIFSEPHLLHKYIGRDSLFMAQA